MTVNLQQERCQSCTSTFTSSCCALHRNQIVKHAINIPRVVLGPSLHGLPCSQVHSNTVVGLDVHYIRHSNTTYSCLAAAQICNFDGCCEACQLPCGCSLSYDALASNSQKMLHLDLGSAEQHAGGDKHPELPATKKVLG